jgi:hypothetical protein
MTPKFTYNAANESMQLGIFSLFLLHGTFPFIWIQNRNCTCLVLVPHAALGRKRWWRRHVILTGMWDRKCTCMTGCSLVAVLHPVGSTHGYKRHLELQRLYSDGPRDYQLEKGFLDFPQ